MRKKNIIFSFCFLLIILITFIISTINEYERIQSYAIGALGPGIGLVIGSLLREKIKIINQEKFKIDLYVLLSITIVGSLLMSLLIEGRDLKIISVFTLNIVMMILFVFRNARNIESNSKNTD